MVMHVPFPLLQRQVEDLLHECGIDILNETVRFWWKRPSSPRVIATVRLTLQ